MNEMQGRARIVAEARSWRGTPYHHQADVKGVGVDCALLLVRVCVDLGFSAPFDPRPYPTDWFLHRDEERFLGFVWERAHKVDRPKPGDVIVMRCGRCFAHGGVVTGVDPLVIVHAFQPYGRVIEERLDQNPDVMRRRPALVFGSFW